MRIYREPNRHLLDSGIVGTVLRGAARNGGGWRFPLTAHARRRREIWRELGRAIAFLAFGGLAWLAWALIWAR